MNFYKRYVTKYKIPFFIAILCVTAEAVCDLLGPTLMSHIVRRGIEQSSLPQVFAWGGRMLFVALLGACFAVTRNNLSSDISQKVGADLRMDLFTKIMSFSEEGADRLESGSLITRMTNDTSQIVLFVNGIMRIFLKAPITCIGSIILASMLNIRLAFILYGVILVIAVLIYFSMKLSYPRFYRLQEAIDRMNIRVQEYLIGIRLVKAFGTYEKESEKFEDTNDNLMKMGISSQIIITFISPLLTLIVGMGTILVICLGSFLFTSHQADAGDMTAFTIYMAQILTSLLMISNVFSMFVRTKASTQRINEILDAPSDFAKSGMHRSINADIQFEDVTFTYPNGSGIPALANVSFQVNTGENLAIIGPTGSGKSTIASLLLRFYDVTRGQILLGGYLMQELGIDEIRRQVAIVPQKAMLFSGSIVDNIRWGKETATKEDVAQSLLMAEGGFAFEMQDGTDSMLGSGGVNLSGGQKQRISIARGTIKNASVLILDDSMSALDAITEAKVRDNLKRRSQKQTVITITQRCGTAMLADKILVLDNGKNIGVGTHEELMKTCPVYIDLYTSQMESSREIHHG